MNTYTINRHTRSLGFGWSTVPTGKGTEISKPTVPQVEGTVKQILENIRVDRTLRSLRTAGVFINTGWFYKGRRIVAPSGRDNWPGLNLDDTMGMLLDGDVDKLEVTVI